MARTPSGECVHAFCQPLTLIYATYSLPTNPALAVEVNTSSAGNPSQHVTSILRMAANVFDSSNRPLEDARDVRKGFFTRTLQVHAPSAYD